MASFRLADDNVSSRMTTATFPSTPHIIFPQSSSGFFILPQIPCDSEYMFPGAAAHSDSFHIITLFHPYSKLMQARYFPRKRAVLKRICKLPPVNIGDVLAQIKLMTSRTFHSLIHSPRFLRNVCFRSCIRLHTSHR